MDENNEIAVVGQYSGSNLPVTRADFEALSDQRKLLLEFTAKQLRKEVDYGVIPGTPKPSLFKPGAEKLSRLFGLGVRYVLTDKMIERAQNFAMFTYKAEIYHLKTGQVIAECEASCNSQEKKYKERTVWEWSEAEKKKIPRKEITPIFDIMNTLQKMAQKRAMVGGVILAVGASDFFTQDFDDVEEAQAVGAVPAVTDAPSAIPKVVSVSSEPQVVHDSQRKDMVLVEAMTSYEQKDMARAAGFKWDKENKRWAKFVSPEERAALGFETREIQ